MVEDKFDCLIRSENSVFDASGSKYLIKVFLTDNPKQEKYGEGVRFYYVIVS